MITQTFTFRDTIANGRVTSKSRRTVVITGKKDLNAFADVLLRQATEARTAGEASNADRLERLAAKVRQARRFEIPVPLDAKLG